MACCVFVRKASFGLEHIFYPIAKHFKAVVLILYFTLKFRVRAVIPYPQHAVL